jgi:hypothetical protein
LQSGGIPYFVLRNSYFWLKNGSAVNKKSPDRSGLSITFQKFSTYFFFLAAFFLGAAFFFAAFFLVAMLFEFNV